MQRTYGAALIGLGVMGLRMVERINAHPGFSVAAGCDPSPAAREAARAASPSISLTADLREAVERDDVHVVYVATPPALHPEAVHLALDRGKALFCEKPLTADLEAGRRIAERVAAEGARAAVNFSLAASPAFRALQDEVAHGAVGRPQRIALSCAFREWPRPWQRAAAPWLSLRADGGFVREVVSHFLFAALRVGGPLAVRSARAAFPADGRSCETDAEAELTAGGLPFRISGGVGRTDADDSNLFVVEGDAGAVRIRDWAQCDRRADDGAWETLSLGTVEEVRWRGALAQLDELHAMMDGRPHRLATVAEAWEVQRAAEAILAGA